jgi:hypothetical protein
MKDAAIQVAIDNLPYVRGEEAVLPRKDLIVDLFKSLEVILHTMIVVYRGADIDGLIGDFFQADSQC